jgi:hypothetical protein
MLLVHFFIISLCFGLKGGSIYISIDFEINLNYG